MSTELWKVSDEHRYSSVTADFRGGELHISCCDGGDLVEELFGDEDYEYWYTLDSENKDRLLAALRRIYGEEDVWALLRHCFNGDQCFMEFCKQNDVKYRFFCYA